MGKLENVCELIDGWQVTCRYTDGVFVVFRPDGSQCWHIDVDQEASKPNVASVLRVLEVMRDAGEFPHLITVRLMEFWDERRRYWVLRHDRRDRERERVLEAVSKCLAMGEPASGLAALVLRISESAKWRDALLVLLEEDASDKEAS